MGEPKVTIHEKGFVVQGVRALLTGLKFVGKIRFQRGESKGEFTETDSAVLVTIEPGED